MCKKGQIAWNKNISPSQEVREKISKTLKEKYANGLKTGFQKGHPCYSYNLKEWHKTNPVWNKGKKYSHKIKPTKERCLKIAEKLKGNHNSRPWKDKVTDKHREIARKRRLKQRFLKSDTKIEIKVQNLLKENGIEFKTQYPILNRYLADIFIKPNIVVEVDGDYWHNRLENIYKDKLRDINMQTGGYKVVRLKEKEINNNLLNCLGKIKQEIMLY